MVYVIKDFNVIKEHVSWVSSYIPYFRVFYMVEAKEGKEYVKIRAGDLAYVGEYTDEIKDWIKEVGAVEVVQSMDADFFFARGV